MVVITARRSGLTITALAEMQVPGGFTIPFFRYQQFLQQNGMPEPIDACCTTCA